MRVFAIVAAAGQGTRLGAEIPKAYVRLQGRSLLEHSVAAMAASGVVDEVLVTVSPEMEDYARKLLIDAPLPLHFVHGAGERVDSVWQGVQAVPASDGVVLVHDAARALTPPGMIARVTQTVLSGAVAVAPVVPVADTIKVVAGDQIVDTPDRSTLRAVQTPQGFLLSALREANDAYFASDRSFLATDDASLMEWMGHRVTTVQGDPMAFKITTPIDYKLAQAVVEASTCSE